MTTRRGAAAQPRVTSSASSAAATRRLASRLTVRVASRLAFVMLAACRAEFRGPLTDLPATGTELRAVLAVHDRDCDSFLGAFGLFDRDDVRRAIPLVGVVALDAPADTARVRRALAAFDVPAPLIAVRPATLATLRAAALDEGMTVLVVRRDRVALTLRPPRGANALARLRRDVLALASAHHPSTR